MSLAQSIAAPQPEAQSQEYNRPNFLVILADDMGFSDAGCYGGEVNTPNLDKLAENGLRFTQFYSTGRCWPSRACLLTGYYAQQVGMDPVRRELKQLPDWALMLPEYLKQLGYRSYHSGKWHIVLEDKPVRFGGFDRSYRIRDHNRLFYPNNHFLDDQPLPPVSPDDDFYITTEIADRTIEFLKQHEAEHGEQPWFAYVAFNVPHFPLQAPQADIDRYRDRYQAGWEVIRRERLERMKQMGIVGEQVKLPPRQPEVIPPWNFAPEKLAELLGPGEVARAVSWDSLSETEKEFQTMKMAIHAAMVDRMDREIGRLLEQVEAMGDRENTVLFFMSDNGASAEIIVRGDGHDPSASMGSGETFLCLGPGWSTASNTPFRLHKSWVHEGGIASPLIVNWPSGLKSRVNGALRHTPGHFIDIPPTILELAGGNKPSKPNAPPWPGRSLVPVFENDARIERPYLFFHHSGNRAIRVGDWKLVSPRRNGEWQLYNLAEDRNELDDLSGRYSERVQELRDLWQRQERLFEQQAEAGMATQQP